MNVINKIPQKKSGDWEIKQFTVSKKDESFSRIRAAANPQRGGRYVPAGTYIGLIVIITLLCPILPTSVEIIDGLSWKQDKEAVMF